MGSSLNQSISNTNDPFPHFQTPFVYVHLYELLYRGSLATGGPLKSQLMAMKPRLIELKKQHAGSISKQTRLPLYVRINTLKTSNPAEVARQLLRDFPDSQVSGDPHVNFLFKFPSTTNFSQYPLYKNGTLIIQDKASCLPAVALSPPSGSTVLDACSAPGNKTLHLAAIMEGQGRVVAVERDRKRFNRLKGSVKRHGAESIITPVCSDFLEIDPNSAEYRTVTHILLDPSCSGSGMVTENLVTQFKPITEERIAELVALQTSLLTHALRFPSLRRVVYSTCSLYQRENEEVVRGVLADHPEWEVVPVIEGWARRGLDGMEGCVRCLPEDGTNGFFLACLMRKDRNKPAVSAPPRKVRRLLPVSVFVVGRLERRFKLPRGPYKYPYKFVAI